MTTITIDRAVVERALEALIENARLLGATQAKKGFGCYSQQDARLERAWREGIAKHSAALRAALAQQPEPVRSQQMAAAGFTRRPSLWSLQAREALELIAAPQRPDGTWNRDREACRQLAAEALGRYDDE